MRITIISLVLVLFAVGCSKKENASAPPRFTVARSDITPAAITTNVSHGTAYYFIQIKLSSAKEAEFWKFAQLNSNGVVEVVLGSETHSMRVPTKGLKPPIQWALCFSSFGDAVAAEKDLSQ